MELTEIAIIVSCAAGLVSVLSFFKANKKDQSELDEKQNERISQLDIKVGLFEQGQGDMKERLSKCEAKLEVMPSEIAKSMNEMEGKIEKRISSMERNLTDIITSAMKGGRR